MTEKPIIFSGPMVKAILDGRKTQTRRVMKPQPKMLCDALYWKSPRYDNGDGVDYFHTVDTRGIMSAWVAACPLSVDRLWVRETWADVNTEEGPAILYRASGNYQHWRDFSTVFGEDYGAGPSMDYDAYPGDYCMWWTDLLNGEPDHGWRSPIHMWRWASRINLGVAGIRVERLQDITGKDAIAEGIDLSNQHDSYVPENQIHVFKELWDSINAKKHPWSSNPWVWVVDFRRSNG